MAYYLQLRAAFCTPFQIMINNLRFPNQISARQVSLSITDCDIRRYTRLLVSTPSLGGRRFATCSPSLRYTGVGARRTRLQGAASMFRRFRHRTHYLNIMRVSVPKLTNGGPRTFAEFGERVGGEHASPCCAAPADGFTHCGPRRYIIHHVVPVFVVHATTTTTVVQHIYI